MSREEAIEALIGTWAQRDSEFLVGDRDMENASWRELREALKALGVTDEELPDFLVNA